MASADGYGKPGENGVRTSDLPASGRLSALFQRPRQGTLGFGGEPRLMLADETGADR